MAERGKKRLQAAGGAAAKGNAVSVGSDGKVLLRIGLDGFHNETVKDLSLRCGKILHLGGKHHLADAAGRQLVVAPRIVIVDAHDHRSPAGGGILGAHGFARVPAVPGGGLPVKEVLTVGHIDDRQPLAFLVSRHEHTHTAVVLAGIGQHKIIQLFLQNHHYHPLFFVKLFSFYYDIKNKNFQPYNSSFFAYDKNRGESL